MFDSATGTRAVLVGGQAVAFWADLYRARIRELAATAQVFVSDDVDFLGDEDDANACARYLGGRVHVNAHGLDGPPLNSAIVEFRDSAGERRRVDFLVNLCGVKDPEAIRQGAVRFEAADASAVLHVMDPLTCVRTRIANIRGIPRTDPKSLQQARVAIWTAREWLKDPDAGGDIRGRLKAIERFYRWVLNNDEAQNAAVVHGIETFEVIQPHDGLPPEFRARRFPQMRAQIKSNRSRLLEIHRRRVASGIGPSGRKQGCSPG